VSESRQAALDRQRELALQRARQRSGVGSSTIPVIDSGASRALSRAAPSSLFGGKTDDEDVVSDSKYDDRVEFGSRGNSSGAMRGSGMSFGSNNNASSGASSAVAEALRVRERMRTIAEPTAFDDRIRSDTSSYSNEPSEDPRASSSGSYRSSETKQSTPRKSAAETAATSSMAPLGTASGDMPVMQSPFPIVAAPAVTSVRATTEVVGTAALDLSDIRRFVTTPVPKSAGIVQCSVERDKSGLGLFYPTYTVQLCDGNKFLMVAKKRQNNKTANYLISVDKRDASRDSASYVGKVRANFVGTEFTIYDDGQSPESRGHASSATQLRQELGIVNYASNVLGSRGPRKMKVAVPKVIPDGRRVLFQPDGDEDSMQAKLRAGYIQDMFLLINKPPKWNDQVGAYVLNFSGRVTHASVKNFQLVSPDDHDTVVLQFGRTAKDGFSMDFQWPLSPLQAFAICCSACDTKLACE
jgi:tubby and related proteins